MQTLLLVTLPELMQVQVHCELDTIGFAYEAPTLPLPPLETPKEEEDSNDDEMDIHLFNDTLTSLIIGQGFQPGDNCYPAHSISPSPLYLTPL
ncbi:hypothetical protein P691DRAFT_765274 [Macrolepiota fuliginosa MF-IS2]|uniref:Uncharacterized protein n=1 Tax=Macrolepiota fuliginosa MF-IS2 TaxID=1400762 RepID=A0A9P6BWW7_9AGAR|nr:hypothetical protein P691DRAFT_765274 [Macrolepiota fuliginosa MF-IS2]